MSIDDVIGMLTGAKPIVDGALETVVSTTVDEYNRNGGDIVEASRRTIGRISALGADEIGPDINRHMLRGEILSRAGSEIMKRLS